jgi:hypothetical protein
MYYNSLRVINGEFSQQTSMPRHLSPLKNNYENYRKIYFFKLVPQPPRKIVVYANLYFYP